MTRTHAGPSRRVSTIDCGSGSRYLSLAHVQVDLYVNRQVVRSELPG